MWRERAREAGEIEREIQDMPDTEKLRLVDRIMEGLDKPDAEIDRVWAEESRQRWESYKAGKAPTVSYESVMQRYRRA